MATHVTPSRGYTVARCNTSNAATLRALVQCCAGLHNTAMTTDERRAAALKIAAHTALDPRTVAAVFDGRSSRSATRRAVETAARELSIALPSATPARRRRAA